MILVSAGNFMRYYIDVVLVSFLLPTNFRMYIHNRFYCLDASRVTSFLQFAAFLLLGLFKMPYCYINTVFVLEFFAFMQQIFPNN